MELWQAIILALVEGVTEYLPVSSTGHLILVSALMGIHHESFTKDFVIMVQFGAIFAVFVEYFRIFIKSFKIYPVLVFGFLPAGILGLLVKKKIDMMLESVWVVAIALLVGGVVLVFTDKIFKKERGVIKDINDIEIKSAAKIGIFQCMAFVPGISRSAATIIGGLTMKLDQRTATEFSFLLALPTLAGATLLKAYKVVGHITFDQWKLLFIGNIVSFVVGYFSIRFFLNMVVKFGLKGFGYYRIALGLVVISALIFDIQLVA
jgi:undecaprenyl-diphosphatase